MYKCSEMSECTFVSLQCCEGEDSSGGWQGPSGSCVQPEHALQVERPAHPDLTSASKPVGKNTRSHRKEKIEIWTPKSEIYSFILNLGQFTQLSLRRVLKYLSVMLFFSPRFDLFPVPLCLLLTVVFSIPPSISSSLSLYLKLPHSSATYTMSQGCSCATQTCTPLRTTDKM